MHSRRAWRVVVSVFLAGSLAAPAWAWRGGGRGGWRAGWWGPNLGVVLGSWPWWYDAYSYDAYNPPYPYYPQAYAPYVLERVNPPQTSEATLDDSRHDLRFLKQQIAIARGQIDFAREDGDVTQAQHDAEMHRLDEIEKESHAEAGANGGRITGGQEKGLLRQIRDGEDAQPGPRQERISNQISEDNLRPVNDRIANLRSLLEKKRTGGDITRAQHDGMVEYLDRIEKQSHSDAAANGGALTRDQESAILEQLQRAETSIARNLIVN